MKEFQARFFERVDRTPTVSSFRFKTDPDLDFCAGQFVQLIFDAENKANKQLNKYLSLSCRPGQDFFELTKRRTESEFSQRLWGLSPQDSVWIKGPMGTCIFDQAFKKIGFLIGGIGITPVISMLDHIVYHQLPVNGCLIYSNLKENDIPFQPEIDQWQKSNKNLRVVCAIAEEQPQHLGYRQGMIDAKMVKEVISDYLDRIFFISGPPKMVEAMAKICRELGCDASKIKTENFIGYES